ncbi:MAG: hypothetical protein COA38_18260 [Fluviicola sp.]|nr:MAG: hypothetical protein COA38_18260 [Fluviicola sp.]
MKLFFKLLLFLFIANVTFVETLSASSGTTTNELLDEKEKKEAAIYAVNIKIAPELTTEGSLGSVSWSKSLSEEQINSIIKMFETKCAEKFNANTVCIYKKNKKGKELKSIGGSGRLSGMPVNTFKKAALDNKKDLFIKIDIYITNDGKPVMVGNKKSVIKPRVVAYIKVFDKDKNEIYSHKITKKTLEGVITLNKKNEPLSPENSLKIIETTFSELLEG